MVDADQRALMADDAERVAGMGSCLCIEDQWLWSDNLYRLLELEPQAAPARPELMLSRIHPDDRPALEAMMGSKGPQEPIDIRLDPEFGFYRVLEARRQRTAGSRHRWVATLRDVTHAREQRQALTIHAHVLEAAQTVAQVGSWVWRPQMGTISWSPELYRIMGQPRDHLLTVASFDAQVHEGDLERLQQVRAETMRTGVTTPVELRIVRPDGAVRTIVMHGQSIEDESRWFLGIVHDVTEQRGLENKLRRAETVQAIGRLASGVAHDFNNLLTVILSNAEVLNEASPEDELEDILRAATAGAELTQRLLSMGQLNKAPLAAIQLDQAVAGSAGVMQSVLPTTIALHLDADSDTWIRGDQRQLDQVLLNLVLNARDAIEGKGNIWVGTGVADDGGARIEVCDDGCGVDPDILEKVLDPLFTTKQPGIGVGLGLSMAHGAIEAMGGALSIRARTGGGTCVVLAFPSTTPAQKLPVEPRVGDKTGLRVLIVEDEPGVRVAAQRVLDRAGFVTQTAPGPLQALEMLHSQFDVVLCDVAMPDGGGRVVAKAMEEQNHPAVLVFMTGYAPEEGWLKKYRVISKPFLPTELGQILQAEHARVCD